MICMEMTAPLHVLKKNLSRICVQWSIPDKQDNIDFGEKRKHGALKVQRAYGLDNSYFIFELHVL